MSLVPSEERKLPEATASDIFYGGHKTWDNLDELQQEMLKSPDRMEMPLRHLFTPGLYIREIFMPAGSKIISKIHKTEHPFVISKGRVGVWTEEEGLVVYEAPFTGVTKPGTRRLLYIYEDTIWSTFHATGETDLSKIEEEIIFKQDPPAIVGKSASHEIAA